MFYEVAKQVPVRISVLEIRLKLYLPLRTTLGLAEPQHCFYLALIIFMVTCMLVKHKPHTGWIYMGMLESVMSGYSLALFLRIFLQEERVQMKVSTSNERHLPRLADSQQMGLINW